MHQWKPWRFELCAPTDAGDCSHEGLSCQCFKTSDIYATYHPAPSIFHFLANNTSTSWRVPKSYLPSLPASFLTFVFERVCLVLSLFPNPASERLLSSVSQSFIHSFNLSKSYLRKSAIYSINPETITTHFPCHRYETIKTQPWTNSVPLETGSSVASQLDLDRTRAQQVPENYPSYALTHPLSLPHSLLILSISFTTMVSPPSLCSNFPLPKHH